MSAMVNANDTVLESGIHFKNNTSGSKVLEQSKSGLDKVLECGPLESILPCSESKILDFLITFQEYDYSISDISKNSGVGFKTTLGVIKDLETLQIIFQKRNVGRARMFQINPDSKKASALKKLALVTAISNTKLNSK